MLGIDPDRFTLRRLDGMVRAKQRHEWAQVSSVMALQANCHGGKFGPADFDPTCERPARCRRRRREDRKAMRKMLRR